jgi:hypothetical protein
MLVSVSGSPGALLFTSDAPEHSTVLGTECNKAYCTSKSCHWPDSGWTELEKTHQPRIRVSVGSGGSTMKA